MPEEHWLSFREAVQIVKDHLGTSVGRSEAIVRDACESGEVRLSPPLLLYDDGLMGMDQRPGVLDPGSINADPERRCISSDDFLDWFDRQSIQPMAVKNRRYPEDAKLVTDGIAGIRRGDWANALQAATALSKQARGSSVESTVARLRKKISDALGE
jgi:hypothetical protein